MRGSFWPSLLVPGSYDRDWVRYRIGEGGPVRVHTVSSTSSNTCKSRMTNLIQLILISVKMHRDSLRELPILSAFSVFRVVYLSMTGRNRVMKRSDTQGWCFYQPSVVKGGELLSSLRKSTERDSGRGGQSVRGWRRRFVRLITTKTQGSWGPMHEGRGEGPRQTHGTQSWFG